MRKSSGSLPLGTTTLFTKWLCSSNPSQHPDDYVVIIICGLQRHLVLCRATDKSWTSLPGGDYYEDIIHYEGKFYAVRKNGSIESWDFAFSFPKRRDVATVKVVGLPCKKKYLIKTSEYLLLVGRSVRYQEIDSFNGFYKTLGFDVFKLEEEEQGGNTTKPSWVQVKNIGDNVLFLGESESISLRELPECSEDCIYFTDDDEGARLNINTLLGGRDLGVFSIQDGIIKPYYPNNARRLFPRPIRLQLLTPPVWFAE
nr:TPA_asm: hypothetical protein HUJ06_008367 [Nelumbo nucifera]